MNPRPDDPRSTLATRWYRVIWVRDDNRTRGVVCPGPFTHHEAVTVKSKCTPNRYVRFMLEEVPDPLA